MNFFFHFGKSKGYACGFATTLIWASFYPLGRLLFGAEADSVDPFLGTFVRLAAAAFLFALAIAVFGRLRETAAAWKKDWHEFLLLAAVGILFQELLIFWALKYTTAARAALFANVSPLFTVLFARLALGEKSSLLRQIGLWLGLCGIVAAYFCGTSGDRFDPLPHAWIGDLMAVCSGACWAVYTVWSAGLTKRYGSIVSTAVTMFDGMLLCIPLLWFSSASAWHAPAAVWVGLGGLGAAGGAAFFLWYLGLRYLSPGELGAFGYVSALLSPIFSMIFLGEKLPPLLIAAISMTLGGVVLMTSGKRSAPSRKNPDLSEALNK